MGVTSSLNYWLGVVTCICVVIFIVVWSKKHRTTSVSIGLPFKLGQMTFDTTPQDRIAAWHLYVHLSTRKAALPFNDKHDSIEDIYDSLYSLFDITRNLLTQLPPRHFDKKDGIADLLIKVLNEGVRPHLTRWQVEFRSWMDREKNHPENSSRSPLEIQKDFPSYEELVDDLKTTNTELSKLAYELYLIATKKKPFKEKTPKILPHPPNVDQIT